MRHDDRGEVFLEYLIVLAVIGLVAAPVFVSFGPRIVANYTETRAILLSLDP